jgi:hypothetical protein
VAAAVPPEGRGAQREVLDGRAREREILHATGGENLGQSGSVAERIRLPAALHLHAEIFTEIAQAYIVVPAEGFAIEEIGVRLDPRAAHGIPAAGADFFENAGERCRVSAADVLVDGGLAADEGEIGVRIHQIQDGAAGRDAFVEALTVVPQPDRIEMGVGDDVDDEFFHGVDDRGKQNSSGVNH